MLRSLILAAALMTSVQAANGAGAHDLDPGGHADVHAIGRRQAKLRRRVSRHKRADARFSPNRKVGLGNSDVISLTGCLRQQPGATALPLAFVAYVVFYA